MNPDVWGGIVLCLIAVVLLAWGLVREWRAFRVEERRARAVFDSLAADLARARDLNRQLGAHAARIDRIHRRAVGGPAYREPHTNPTEENPT